MNKTVPNKKQKRDYNSPERLSAMLERVSVIADSHKGKCLSKSYTHCKSPLVFECAVHGKFEAKPKHIVAGHWCSKCRDELRKPDVKERLIQYIQERGGKLKSEYINAREHVVVECEIHGDWKATPTNLLGRRSWCMRCARSAPRGPRKRMKSSVPILI